MPARKGVADLVYHATPWLKYIMTPLCLYICTGRTYLFSGGGGMCIGDSVSRKAQRYGLHAARIARSCDSTPSVLRRVVETEGTARIETNPFPKKKTNTRSRRTFFYTLHLSRGVTFHICCHLYTYHTAHHLACSQHIPRHRMKRQT